MPPGYDVRAVNRCSIRIPSRVHPCYIPRLRRSYKYDERRALHDGMWGYLYDKTPTVSTQKTTFAGSRLISKSLSFGDAFRIPYLEFKVYIKTG